jgi:hypothetical protein
VWLRPKRDAPNLLAAPNEVEAARRLVRDDEHAPDCLDVVGTSAQVDEQRPAPAHERKPVVAVQAGGGGAVVRNRDVVRPARRGVPSEDPSSGRVDEHDLVAALDSDPNERRPPALPLGRLRRCSRAALLGGARRRLFRCLLRVVLRLCLSVARPACAGAACAEQREDEEAGGADADGSPAALQVFSRR